MAVKILLVFFVASLAGAYGGYGNYYPGQYPIGPGYGGNPGFPGGYPQHPGAVGPPGAHPGCPLCDSSVYSYCSKKQAHDACCCNSGLFGYGCQKVNCNFLYANSCQEHQLITNCCCVDLYKGGEAGPQPVIA
ncbi:uncharacterized protein LOC106137416 isoform X2 [Amyelois transitella]|uniref:uncharacterized protein LOC106137416 isoform X2 n=1 Tax=Amyelois transitella TaxID=680683 RepID=UPI00298F5A25|nr:uncharacterized protein LOC106137416 isoform X2 [Amyelois transitella]